MRPGPHRVAFVALVGAFGLTVGCTAEADEPVMTPIHSYELNGSYADLLGGPDLVPDGGVLNDSGYTFGPSEGLTLDASSITADSYRIEFRLRIVAPDLTSNDWIKLIDFSNLTEDGGLYIFRTSLQFFFVNGCGGLAVPPQDCSATDAGRAPLSGPEKTFINGFFSTVIISREGLRGVVRAWVDGEPQVWTSEGDSLGFPGSSFRDPMGEATFGDQALLHFLRDDAVTGFSEAASGDIDYIRVTVPSP